MPLVSTKIEEDIQQIAAFGLQTVEILASQNAVDGQNRQRITLDAIAAGLTLATVTAVGTVTTVTTVTTVNTVSSVTNIAAVSGWDHRQFENPANLLFNSQISANLSFG